MRRLARLAVLVTIGAALVFGIASAQNAPVKKHGQKDLNGQFNAMGGADMRAGGDSLSFQARVTQLGEVVTVRADNPEARDQIANLMLTPLGANGGLAVSQYPWPIKGAKFVELLVTCQMAAAADTDSINVEIFPVVRRTDQVTDGIGYVFDLDQTDNLLTPLYLTRNYYPLPASGATGFKYTRRVFGTMGTGQGAMSNSVSFVGALVDDRGSPLMGDYLQIRAKNVNFTKAIQFLSVDALIHYE